MAGNAVRLGCTHRARSVSRRQLLQHGLTLAAAPLVLPAAALGRDGAVAPSDRITVGVIGTGNQGTVHTQVLCGMPDAQVVAVCDPMRQKRQAARQMVEERYGRQRSSGTWRGCTDHNDFRDLLARAEIDAVFIASPEHWHAVHTIHAARAGKDVYCEKAMSATVAEGQAMVKAVRQYGRVFQTGTQQRSTGQFRFACELVRNGYIGRLQTIRVGDPRGYPGPAIRPEPVPEGFDYDLWLGPARWGPYFADRVVNLKGWMLCYDYTVGFMAGWGQHEIDIVQWGNGTDGTGPVEVEGRGVFASEGLNDTPMTWHTEYTYANGVRLIFTSDDQNPYGIRFEGSDGWVFVNRSGIWASTDSLLKVRFGPNDLRLHESNHHHQDFLDSARSRRDPACPVEAGHRTNIICNLSDIAIRLGRKLKWDPVAERFPDDDQANRMLARAMRPPWRL